ILAVSLVLFILAPLLANDVWRSSGLTPLLRMGVVAGVFSALSAIPTIYFQSLRHFGKNATMLVIQNLILFGGVVLVAWQGWWTVQTVVFTLAVTSFIGAFILLSLVPREALFQRRKFESLSALRDVWKNPVKDSPRSTALAEADPN